MKNETAKNITEKNVAESNKKPRKEDIIRKTVNNVKLDDCFKEEGKVYQLGLFVTNKKTSTKAQAMQSTKMLGKEELKTLDYYLYIINGNDNMFISEPFSFISYKKFIRR